MKNNIKKEEEEVYPEKFNVLKLHANTSAFKLRHAAIIITGVQKTSKNEYKIMQLIISSLLICTFTAIINKKSNDRALPTMCQLLINCYH